MDFFLKIDHNFFNVALILASTFAFGTLMKSFRVPKVTGYIFAGLLLGPSGWHLFDQATIDQLRFLSDIALGLIVFTVGREFAAENLRRLGTPLIWITLAQGAAVFLLVAGLCSLFMPLSIAVILGFIAMETAPSATVLVLREFDSEGPVTDHLMAVLGLEDILCLALGSLAIATVYGMGNPSASFLQAISLPVGKLLASVTLGIAIGLLVSYAQAKGLEGTEGLIVVFVAVLLGTGLSKAWGIDSLLTNLTLGVTHINSAVRGEDYFKNLKSVDLPFYMIFFFLTGADMHLGLLQTMLPAVMVYTFARSAGKIWGTRLGCRFADKSLTLQRYLGLGMLSQAGVAIGLAYHVDSLGLPGSDMILTIVLSSAIFFEALGPLAIKKSIVEAGEVKAIKIEASLRSSRWGGDLSAVLDQLRSSLGIPRHLARKFEGEVLVRHVMRKHIDRIPHDAKFNLLIRMLHHSRYSRLPVVSDNNEFLGLVALDDIHDVVFDPVLNSSVIAWDLATMPEREQVAYSDEPIKDMVHRFENHRVEYLPVVDAENHRYLVGIVTQRDVLTAAFEHGRMQEKDNNEK